MFPKIPVPEAVDKFPIIQAERIKKPAPSLTFNIPSDFVCSLPCFTSAPQYPGGRQNLYKFLSERVQYPQEAIEHNREGKVTIGFEVGKDGSLSKFEVIDGIGMGCDDAVIAALKQSKKWSPGIEACRSVTMKESVSFIFKLTD